MTFGAYVFHGCFICAGRLLFDRLGWTLNAPVRVGWFALTVILAFTTAFLFARIKQLVGRIVFGGEDVYLGHIQVR